MNYNHLILMLSMVCSISLVHANNTAENEPYNYWKERNDAYSFAQNWKEYASWCAVGYVLGIFYPIQPYSLSHCYAAYKRYSKESELPPHKQPDHTYNKNMNRALALGLVPGLATLIIGASISIFKITKFIKNNKIQIVPR